jgi:hypothetical protein
VTSPSPANYPQQYVNQPSTIVPAAPPVDLTARIKNAVIAKLGTQVDQALLDTIIRRVLDQVKV